MCHILLFSKLYGLHRHSLLLDQALHGHSDVLVQILDLESFISHTVIFSYDVFLGFGWGWRGGELLLDIRDLICVALDVDLALLFRLSRSGRVRSALYQ